MNLLNRKKSKSEFNFTLFCIIMILATLVQVLEVKVSENINGDTLFHIIAFIAYLFMFKGVKETPNSSVHQKVNLPT